MLLRLGIFVLCLVMALGRLHDASAAQTNDALVKRIEAAVTRGYWQSARFFILSASVSLERGGLSVFSTRCPYPEGSVQQNRIQCTIQAFASAKVIIIRLGEVDPASLTVREPDTAQSEAGGAVAFKCRPNFRCVADFQGQPIDYDVLVCADAGSCGQLKDDFAELVTKAPPAQQASVTPPGPGQQQQPPRSDTPPRQTVPPKPDGAPGMRTVPAVLESINGNIGRSLYFSGRNLLVTTKLSQSPDGRLELAGHLCEGLTLSSAGRDIEACRALNPTGPQTRVLFRLADLDRTTVRMDDNAGTFRVLFLCRNKDPCVARPDKSAYFPGGFFACPGRDACNRLMADIFELIDLTALRQPPVSSRRRGVRK